MWWRRGVLAHADKVLNPRCKPSWLLSAVPFTDSPVKKGKSAPLQERRMVDRFRIWAKGGEGGSGCWSYKRSRTDRHGTPDGGNGGKGGDVYLECSTALWDFSNLQHHLNAKKGDNGISKNMIGTRGSDKIVQVPVGTVIHLISGPLPTLLSNKSITSMNPWDIPVVDADKPSHDEINDTRFNMVKPPSFLNSADISCNDDREKSACHESKEFDGIKSNMDANAEDVLPEMVLNEHENDEWWKDNEEPQEWHFEAEEAMQYSVAELTEPGQRVLVACGGEGGLGNTAINKDTKLRRLMKLDCSSDTETLDNEELFSLIAGRLGSESVLILELKSIADVGLVGMPNAGKSTLLGSISRANPAIGHYAFTTLRPNIGNLNYDDFFSVTVADIPGLIKGAHENRGLGHAFLRHIERTKVLAFVVDLAATLDGNNGAMPWEQLRDLILELEHHKTGLSKRSSLVIANKIDEKGADDIFEELRVRVHGVSIFPVCAVLGDGVQELKVGLRRLMEGTQTSYLDLNNINLD